MIRDNIHVSCQPHGNNFKDFWSASKSRSWLSVVHGAGHLSFTDLPFVTQFIACGAEFGTDSWVINHIEGNQTSEYLMHDTCVDLIHKCNYAGVHICSNTASILFQNFKQIVY